ncbi:hypothetical protein [Lacinutrix mariniflava]|uniref:hypothetical protein n=1 Tax=Lacinutrix mariniflava TaxID=342955 RepID=UPI0006E3BB35|nr:hypothetical protein [Lacinutrix mariniflava]
MKKFIHKTNKYLLENYPTLWNTKVVWILGITAIIHFIFFFLALVVLQIQKLFTKEMLSLFFIEMEWYFLV